jgi:hypothetical protein
MQVPVIAPSLNIPQRDFQQCSTTLFAQAASISRRCPHGVRQIKPLNSGFSSFLGARESRLYAELKQSSVSKSESRCPTAHISNKSSSNGQSDNTKDENGTGESNGRATLYVEDGDVAPPGLAAAARQHESQLEPDGGMPFPMAVVLCF